jgi:hypothetical protein
MVAMPSLVRHDCVLNNAWCDNTCYRDAIARGEAMPDLARHEITYCRCSLNTGS